MYDHAIGVGEFIRYGGKDGFGNGMRIVMFPRNGQDTCGFVNDNNVIVFVYDRELLFVFRGARWNKAKWLDTVSSVEY